MALTHEERKAQQRAYYYANKEKLAAQAKGYREQHKAEIYARSLAWRRANPDKVAEYSKTQYAKRKDIDLANNKRWRQENPEKELARCQAWREANKEKYIAMCRNWYYSNTERISKLAAIWRDNNRARMSATARAYRQNNPGKVRAKKNLREIAKAQRTPTWLSPLDLWMMEEIYILSELRTRLTGVQCNVDHIIPLRGKKVSGLHVPSNLQIIPAKLNFVKGNRHA
jgi:hypothetical protein